MTRERFIAILREEGITEVQAKNILERKPGALEFNEDTIRLACHLTFARLVLDNLPKQSPNRFSNN